MNTRNDARRSRWPGNALAAFFMTAIAPSGCARSDRLPLFPASGKVVVDGQPAKGVEVRLCPADDANNPDALRPYATTAEDGGFTLGTYDAADGAPEGRYKVTLFWPDRPPGPSHPKDLLGGAYADAGQAQLEAVIAKGQNDLEPFQAKRPAKPAATRVPAKKKGFDGLD